MSELVERVTCRHCGALYKCTLLREDEPQTDSEDCWTCGKLLLAWEDSRYHRIFEIIREGIVR